MNQRSQAPKTHSSRSLIRPALAALLVAVLLPLTAFAGIGAWNGVQRVMLGTAVELAPAVAAAPAKAQEPESSSSYKSSAGFLGVSTTGLTEQLRNRFGIPAGKGVMVTEVTEGSAASFAGIEAGDVIVAVDNVEVDDQSDLRRAVRRAGADSTVALEVYRDGRSAIMDATLGAAPNQRASFTWNGDWDGDWEEHWSAEKWEEFGERMAEFGENFGAEFAEFGERFGEEWAEQFAENAEAFGERMEAWGEEFGRRMEEKFESGEWDKNSFHFQHDGDFNEEEFEEAMERLHEELENLDLEGLGSLVNSALAGIDFDAIGANVEAAIEAAMEAVEESGNNRQQW